MALSEVQREVQRESERICWICGGLHKRFMHKYAGLGSNVTYNNDLFVIVIFFLVDNDLITLFFLLIMKK